MTRKPDIVVPASARVVAVIAAVLILFVTVQCEKDPAKGWDFYYEPPPPPSIVKMNYVVKDCVPPYPVTFYQEAENLLGNVNYEWDFGDGNTSTDKNPNHIYPDPGDYIVRLIVSNEVGADTAYLDMAKLSQSSIPVEADFIYEHFNDNNFAPNKVLFDNLSSGANQFYWYFGDGDEINHDNPEHVYQNKGTYSVTLRGTCTDGTFDEATQQLFVIDPPQRVFIDSINLMLPSAYNNRPIFIELYHNTTFVGYTRSRTISSFPFKFRRPEDFPAGYFFDYVQFSNNEVFKFVVFIDNGEEEPTFLYEIVLASGDIQANFYPRVYYQVETVPSLNDVFIDLYLNY
ncbi:MAG: PKD domain-containing protein [Bacteroidota bacterium]